MPPPANPLNELNTNATQTTENNEKATSAGDQDLPDENDDNDDNEGEGEGESNNNNNDDDDDAAAAQIAQTMGFVTFGSQPPRLTSAHSKSTSVSTGANDISLPPSKKPKLHPLPPRPHISHPNSSNNTSRENARHTSPAPSFAPNNNGERTAQSTDVAYYDRSFVEDPWAALRPASVAVGVVAVGKKTGKEGS